MVGGDCTGAEPAGLHVYEARLRRTDLTVSERRRWEEKAHEMRELVARLGGLPGRGVKG